MLIPPLFNFGPKERAESRKAELNRGGGIPLRTRALDGVEKKKKTLKNLAEAVVDAVVTKGTGWGRERMR